MTKMEVNRVSESRVTYIKDLLPGDVFEWVDTIYIFAREDCGDYWCFVKGEDGTIQNTHFKEDTQVRKLNAKIIVQEL